MKLSSPNRDTTPELTARTEVNQEALSQGGW